VHLSLGKPKYVATSTQAPHGLLESETGVFSTGDFSNGDSPIGEMLEKWSMQLLLIEYRDYDEDTASHRYMCVYTYIYIYIYIYT
jgi:hypothetical protein